MEYLLDITFEDALRQRTCIKCDSIGRVERHHILYNPERIARLCRVCHKRITQMNARVAWKKRKKLNNKNRLIIWSRFLRGY